MLAHLRNDALRFRLAIDRGTASNAMVRYYLTSVAECGCIVSKGENLTSKLRLWNATPGVWALVSGRLTISITRGLVN